MARESDRHVHSVIDALRLLEAFNSGGSLRLQDLHARTGLNRSRILRYAGTLQAGGYLERRANGEYALGLKLYALGSLLAERVESLTDLVRPALRRLSDASENTTFYSILQGFDRLVLAREEAGEGLRFVVTEGSRRPLHSGATGKLLLAYGPPELQERILDDPALSHSTRPASVDREALRRDLVRIRSDSFAISRGEATPHGFAVAVPVVLQRGGGVQYDALTIAGPLGMLDDELAEEYVGMLQEEASAVSRILADGPAIVAAPAWTPRQTDHRS